MRIGVDLDGVCYDFAASLREYLSRGDSYYYHRYPDPTHWEFYEDWDLTLDEFLVYCHRGVEAGIVFSHGDPHPGTREALDLLRSAGHTLHIVTDRFFGRSGQSAKATFAWLDRHHLPYDSVTFSSDKAVVRLDAMIEDKPANYDALVAAGVRARLLDRPWNQHPGDSRRRVSSLIEFAEEFA